MKNKCLNCCIIEKVFVPLQCSSEEWTARATSQPIWNGFYIYSVMYDVICYYVQQIVYWTLYFGVAGFVIYIFIGQQIHDARIMLGKDKKEESKETKNI